MVLVGGFGTRLRPLTLDRPKQMLPIAHRPMLEVVLQQLKSSGIDEAVLSLGYKPDAFLEAYPDGVCAGVRLKYAVEPEPLGTAGAIKFAAEAVGISDSAFLAVNGDVICDAGFSQLIDSHQIHAQNQAQVTLLATRVSDPSSFGALTINQNSQIEDFSEKPQISDEQNESIFWVNGGVYVLEASVLDLISEGHPVSIEREIFPALASKAQLFAYTSDAYWIDAGTPGTYLKAQFDIAQKQGVDLVHKAAEIDVSADIQNSLVGEGVKVGPDAEVKNSVLLPGSEVQAGARVMDSILGFGATIGREAVLSDLCVIGDGEEVPAEHQLSGSVKAS